MRETINTRDVITGLRVARHQIEQWVARDYLRPRNEAKGRAGREWTYDDVFAIALLDRASDMGLSLQKIREVSHFGAPKFLYEETFLLIAYGEKVRLIPDSLGLTPEQIEEKQANAQIVSMPTHTARWDFIDGSDLYNRIGNDACKGAIIIPLNPIEELVQRLFEDEAEAGGRDA